MSIKHVKAYYTEVCEQYKSLREELREYQEYASTHVISPDIIANLENTMAPLKQNYERLSYIMYLLNKPNKKEKQKKYEKRVEKLMASFDENNSLENVKNENEQVIKEVHDLRG